MMKSSKTCSKCGAEKPLADFYTDPATKDGYHYHCKECNKANVKRKQRQLKLDLIKYKGGKCADCGGTFHPSAYDFHHLDPTEKEGNISNMSRAKAFAEADKCVLLCANCHRVRHSDFDAEEHYKQMEMFNDKGSTA